jgi:peptidoglycan/xylan/chitin deacetylase (PgdA/CDA1 family)
MYHEIVQGQPKEIHAVSADQFALQMQWLAEAGYQTASLEDWLAACAGARPPLPHKSVVITFDDGYLDNYSHALPILREHNFQATIFLVSGLMEHTSRWREPEFSQAPLMSWAQARAMTTQGITFGSHTVNHPDLTAVDLPTVRQELTESKQQIEQALGQPVVTFAYPMSRYNRQVRAVVPECGYQAACICPTGYVGQAGSHPFELLRITLLATDTLEDFSQKMRTTLRRRLHWYRRVAGRWKRQLLAAGRQDAQSPR